MAKSKKVTKQAEVDTNTKIKINTMDAPADLAFLDGTPIATEQPETPQTAPQQEAKPLFTADNSEIYRTLLLERPNVPFITNMQEAVEFVGRYEKWNRKVQSQFK
jgi:hypothetical protein